MINWHTTSNYLADRYRFVKYVEEGPQASRAPRLRPPRKYCTPIWVDGVPPRLPRKKYRVVDDLGEPPVDRNGACADLFFRQAGRSGRGRAGDRS